MVLQLENTEVRISTACCSQSESNPNGKLIKRLSMNQLKLLVRNLRKKWVLTGLRTITVILGTGVALYIFELNSFEKSFDSFWPEAERI